MGKLVVYLGLTMVVIYVLIGLLFLFTNIAAETFPANRMPLGLTFCAYGLFRFYSTYKKLKQKS